MGIINACDLQSYTIDRILHQKYDNSPHTRAASFALHGVRTLFVLN